MREPPSDMARTGVLVVSDGGWNGQLLERGSPAGDRQFPGTQHRAGANSRGGRRPGGRRDNGAGAEREGGGGGARDAKSELYRTARRTGFGECCAWARGNSRLRRLRELVAAVVDA